jgi:hypothetical protein
VPGGETIGSVGIVWGGVPDGKAMTSKLWSDPNGDGDPADAVLLSSVAGVTSDAGTDTFATYDIPDVTLTLGQSFFVGGTITHLEGEFPLAFDEDPPISDESWADETADFGPGSSPFNLGPIFGDLMVRATGIPAAPVPEPHLLTLLGVALAALALTTSRRRRTSPRGPR